MFTKTLSGRCSRIVCAIALFGAMSLPSAASTTRELPASEFRGTMITMTRGTVVSMDAAAKRISISHQGNWDIEVPATTTSFAVPNAEMLNGIAVGAAVFFVAAGDARKPELVRLSPRRPNGFTY